MANKKVSQLTSKPSVLTTDLFPIADPSTGQLYKTTISDLGTAIGSGVSSVNSLVGAVVLDTDDIQELVSPTNKWFTDTRARAALSASSPLTYNSGTGVFGIQVANGSQNGYLSSADWTTFNNKQAALNGTGFVKISGTTISYDNSTYLTTSAAASTYLALAGGTMTGVLFGASASFSGYVGFGGNTSPLYQVDVTGSGRFSGDLRIESTNPRIYLTDTDNNPDYFISNTDGTFTVYDVTNSTARFTIGTTGNATFTNAITGGGSITGESIYSNGIISAGSSVTATRLILSGGTGNTGLYFGHTDRVVLANYGVGGIDFEVNSGTIVATLFPSGNFGLGIALDAGYKLDVNGTARISGAISGTSATFSSSVTAGSGTSSGYATLNLIDSGTGSARYASIRKNYDSPFDLRIRASNSESSAPIVFDLSNAVEAMRITSSGNVGIGTTSPNRALVVSGGNSEQLVLISSTTKSGISLNPSNTTFSPYIGSTGNDIVLETSGGERMRITSTGFIGVNQTSPYQRFDVSGAIRSGVGVSSGASIAKAVGRTLYKVIVSSNYDAGGAVRGGEWNVLLSNEGDAVTNTTQIYVYNNQTATFSVSGGNLIINGLNSGNTICAVYTN